MTEKDKLKSLLKELFQFDCADLDFGIYRIMNFKRDAIDKFIEKDLIETVGKELSSGILGQQTQAALELDKLVTEVKAKLGDDAIDGDGILDAGYRKTPLGKRYVETQERAKGAKPGSAVEASIYNHLISFFSRYYDSGDFISKRRYSRREKYAIPYNGEEVYLHWANSDQYYVKTTEYFTDYRYKAPNGYIVHFKLKAADVEKDNVKGDKRFFIPLVKETVLEQSNNTILIPFEYRPLTGQEDVKYPAHNIQEAIIEETVPPLIEAMQANIEAATALGVPHHKTDKGKPVSYLEHHIRQYTRRNTSDYFIHKDLKGFLTRELDFYIKNEVLFLDELEAGGELLAKGWFQIARVIRAIGSKVIEFLSQIEDFQKKLFEKKKFVLDTQYCITVGNIKHEFYPEIVENESQWQEWKELFHIDEDEKTLFNSSAKSRPEKRLAFLQSHPTLVLDTKHFSLDFKDKLLASFESLDDMLDGLAINSENYQAINMLQDSYSSKIKSIYIDPPYNTDASAILYKNDYKDSSWLSLMENRLYITRYLMTNDGIICVAIDDVEASVLKLLMARLFSKEIGITAVRSNPAGRKTKGRLAPAHEYALFYGLAESAIPGSLEKTEKMLSRYPLEDDMGKYAWANFIRSGSGDKREDRPTLYYPIFVDGKNKIRVPMMTWDDKEESYSILEKPANSETVVYPIVKEGNKTIEKRWHRGYERVANEPEEFRVRRTPDGSISIDFKTRMDEDALPITWWDKSEYASANYGALEIKNILGKKVFDFAKSMRLVQDCIRVCSNSSTEEIILDYFAGSGTTGHATISLNREDGGHRKFILVEMGKYFNSVLMPRLKKIAFAPEWKEGKPRRQPTDEEAIRSPRIIKYFQMESYEDTLSNIILSETPDAQFQFDDYFLSYMLEFESKENESMLSVEKLSSPFSYKLTFMENGENVEKEVDLPETFGYLLGLQVQSRKVLMDEDRRYLVYRGVVNDRDTVVIWRDTTDWKEADFDRDRKFVSDKGITEEADEILVNGDSVIPNAKSLDPIFKARMFGGK
jgi:adenine-specific DNA-methyltransferase